MRQHVLEILQEADTPDGSLHVDEIYERLLYRTTKQEIDAMIRDGLMVHFECCGGYALSSMVRDGKVVSFDCGCNALDREK